MGSNSQTAVFNPNTKADAHPFSGKSLVSVVE